MRGTRLSLLAGLALLLLGAAPLQAAPTAEDRCASRMAEASGRYLDCAMRENGRAAKHRRAVNLDRCERKLGRMTAGALRRWGPEVCPSVNQVGGEATTLGDQLSGLVSEMSEAVGVSDEDLYDDAALCAAQKAKVVGQDLRCRAGALARAARWDRPVSEAACPERRLARKLARIEKKYGDACPGEGDAGTLATRGQLALSEVTDWVAPSMQRHAGVTDPLPLQKFPDADGDGIPDNVEIGLTGTDPLHPDTDHDGRSDTVEFFHHKTDPLKYDFPFATQNTEAAAKNARMPGPTNYLFGSNSYIGIPDTPIALALAGMSVVCDFTSCNSGYTGEATRARIDVLSTQISGEFTALKGQLGEVNQELSQLGSRMMTDFDQTDCNNAKNLVPDLTQNNCLDDPYSVQCLHSKQAAAVKEIGGEDVRPFFDAFGGKSDTSDFLLKDKLLTEINHGHGDFKGYGKTIKSIQNKCRDWIKDKKLVSADSDMLGGDLIYHRLMATFLTGSFQSYRSAIGFLSTFRSAQAWYYASPDLRKDAFWLAMQDQNTALIPGPLPEHALKHCRYAKKECDTDKDCGMTWDTCQTSYPHYEPGSRCGADEILVGTEQDGRCVEFLPNNASVWHYGKNGFKYNATVTTQGMQAMNHICEAWSLRHPKPCGVLVVDPYTPGYYCQEMLCEPAKGASQTNVTNYFKVGRDYLNALLSIGAPFTNADFIYEPTRDVMWLKDPGWGEGITYEDGAIYQGIPNSRFFFYDSDLHPDYTVASWPSKGKEKEKVVLTPATRAHWMGEGSALTLPNTDGMGAAAQVGQKTCSGTKKHCRVETDCGTAIKNQTCGENAQNQLRAKFAPSLLQGMANKGGLVWPGSRVQKIGTCSGASPNSDAACNTDYDCSYVGAGTCQVTDGQLACHDGIRHGSPCEADWHCRELGGDCGDPDPRLHTNTGTICECKNTPGNSTVTSVQGQPGNLACAAGWKDGHLLLMGASIHGTIGLQIVADGDNSSEGYVGRIGSTPMFGYLKDSWGFNLDRLEWANDLYAVPTPQKAGSCRTKISDLMPYPYVREFTKVGGPLSRDYGLEGLSGGQEIDCTPHIGFPYVNIHNLIHGDTNGLRNTADMSGGEGFWHSPAHACHNSSPVGMFGAWPNHPPWPATSSPTRGYNAGMNFGLSCNWLDAAGKFSRCEDPTWDGGECSSRKRTAAENSLNFVKDDACKRENERPLKYTFTTSIGNACANLEGDVECKKFDGLKDYMKDINYCLYPIKERKGSTDFYPNKAFPIACGNASKGCSSNSSAPPGRNWINFRQCLSFSTAPNCAHLGVQTPYLLSVTSLSDIYPIWPLVTPGGVASSTEMVAAYAVNSLSRGFDCGKTTVYGKSYDQLPHVAGNTVMDSGFMQIQSKLGPSVTSVQPASVFLHGMWPVVDLFAAGQTAQLIWPEVADQDSGKPIKKCSTTKRSCTTDADCESASSFGGWGSKHREKCVDVVAKRDGYAKICPGANDWTSWDDGQPLYSYWGHTDVDSVLMCARKVTSGSRSFDRPNHDKAGKLPQVCETYFGSGVNWDSDHLAKVLQDCRGDKEVSYRCHEHCMWALKCQDAFNSVGVDQASRTGIENLQKVVALSAQNFDKIGRDPSSCCSEGLCENQLQRSIAPAIPAVFASYQEDLYNPSEEQASPRMTCHGKDEAWVNKVDGLQSCLHKCNECDGSLGSAAHCDGMRCEYAHYNATWCTLFPSCDTPIEDPYGGTLYTRGNAEAWHQETTEASATHLLGDANRVPSGALYGNRACRDEGAHGDANVVAVNGLSLSECADACAQQNYTQTRYACSISREFCFPNEEDATFWPCGDRADTPEHGSCVPAHEIRWDPHPSPSGWQKYAPVECGFFSFYGAKWDHQYSDIVHPVDIGSDTTCTLYPKGYFKTDGTCDRQAPFPQGWAVWPAPKATTWSRDDVDCTNPGGNSSARTCSRGVSESYARAFLDTGLSETQFLGTVQQRQLQQGSKCGPSTAGSCDTNLGLTCTNGRCAGPVPGEAHGPCKVEKRCHFSGVSCTLGAAGLSATGQHQSAGGAHDSCYDNESWLHSDPFDQCIPLAVCNAGLTCRHAGSSSSDSSGFWMTEAWRPGGTCVPTGSTGS